MGGDGRKLGGNISYGNISFGNIELNGSGQAKQTHVMHLDMQERQRNSEQYYKTFSFGVRGRTLEQSLQLHTARRVRFLGYSKCHFRIRLDYFFKGEICCLGRKL